MDIVKTYADKIIRRYFSGNARDVKKVEEAANSTLWDLRQDKDKIRFLNMVLEAANIDYEKHLLECKNKETCDDSKNYAFSIHFLQNELYDLGINADEDTFTIEEKEIAESKLNKILEEINKLSLGQELIYNEMMAEIEELRELYYLGKKNWYQILIGKAAEMTAGGVVGNTVSQKIIETFSDKVPKLLSNL